MSEKICSCCGNIKGCDCFSTQSQQFSRIAELEAELATERARWLRVNHSDANSTLSKGDFDAAREKE